MKSTSSKSDPDVLERNVTTLLESGGDAPRLDDGARTRIRAELVQKYGAARGEARPGRPRAWALGLGLAATGAAALVVANVVGDEAAAPTALVANGKLADGTTWLVDTGGTVTVVGDRRVRVEGSALLDVAPGGTPFVVETARGTIEVLGTRFLVNAEASRTTTAVVRGQVKLATDGGHVLLHAGEQGIAEPGKPPTRGPAPRLSHLASWAQQARAKDEGALVQPLRNGTLYARDPNNPRVPESPLPIHKLQVDVVVEDQVARVAIDQTFWNPAPQVMEGMYRFAIPPDASLQRLAMYVDGTLMESAVVERMRARRIYEEIVYRRLDPALLEWAGTGRLSLRVYPLPSRQEKRLLLAYTQSLPKLYDDWTIQVPFPEVDTKVGELAFDVRVKNCGNCEVSSPSHRIEVRHEGEDAVVTYRQTGVTLGDSLVLRTRDKRPATVATFRDGSDDFVLVRAKPDVVRTAKAYRPRTWVLLNDVSASRGPMELRAQADLVDGFLKELDEDDRVAVLAFDVAARQKLPLTRVMDVDRKAVYAALKAEGGVGATNFSAALAAATMLLGQVAPDDATIVYVGDGVITTGTRDLDAIAKQLAGKAQFVGVGVGDGPDTQTLHALAAATGGYATAIDLADDVAWRAFDLVAALHTPRVTNLSAKLVDASGAHVPSTLYVKTPQLADGEELELVGKLATTTAPAFAIVSGTLDGTPWEQRIAITAPRAGGYLPRLWAQRHIDARLLAKHAPVVAQPCAAGAPAPTACPTEAELRAKRDEDLRQEIVALGKQYFLLSRHTSLIVLENDKMYADYGVTKGRGDTWAPYQVPATIAVAKPAQPALANVAADAELVRSPLRLFLDHRFDFEAGDLAVLRGGHWNRDRYVTSRNQLVTGASFGSPPDVGAGPMTAARSEHAKEAKRASRELERRDVDTLAQQQVSSDEVLGGLDPWGGDEEQRIGWGRVGLGRGAGTGSGYGLGGTSGRYGGGGSRWITPQRLVTPQDPAYDDVTAFVPALVADEADAWRRVLGTGATKPFAIDPAARTLLDHARRALPAGTYRWGDFEIAVDSARRFGWKRTTDVDLAETASFDGQTFTRRYPELGLDITRPVADGALPLALGYFPLWIATPAEYARYFEVGVKGPRQVTLSRPALVRGGKAELVFVLELDAQHRLVAITDAAQTALVRVTWSATGPTAATLDGATLAVGFTAQSIGDAAAWAHGRTNPGVTVELPGHLPAYFTAKLATLTPGSAAWRHLQRQHLVSLAATDARAAQWAVYEALREHGGVELGDLALASGGVATYASEPYLASLPVVLGDQPLVRYVAAARAYHRSSRLPRRPAPAPGFIGALWTLRDVSALLHAARSQSSSAGLALGKQAVERSLAIGGQALTLKLVAAGMVANHHLIPPAEVARVFDAVAVGPYRNVARAQAATVFANRGQYDAAAERIVTLVADLDLAAAPADLSHAQYHLQLSRRGQAGWELLWAAWRDRVLASTSYEHVMALLGASSRHPHDESRIFARAVELAGPDTGRVLPIAKHAMARGQTAWALTQLEPLVKTQPSRELHQLVANIQLAQGRIADALGNLEAAQAIGGDEAVGLSTLRGEYTQLVTLARQLALQSTGAARDAAIARAMAWATQWRAVDASNPQIDSLVGELLLAVGNTEEAWRQLSSVIERDPTSGTGYATVAYAFEQQGRVAEAVELWHQAMVLDQTNPEPRLRKARALFALGKTADGDTILSDILSRTWHERHAATVAQVQELVRRGKPAK